MGGRGSWSSSGGTFAPTAGGMSNGGGDENVLGPRIPGTLQEALGQRGRPMSVAVASAGTNPHYSRDYAAYSSNCQRACSRMRREGAGMMSRRCQHTRETCFLTEGITSRRYPILRQSCRKIENQARKPDEGIWQWISRDSACLSRRERARIHCGERS